MKSTNISQSLISSKVKKYRRQILLRELCSGFDYIMISIHRAQLKQDKEKILNDSYFLKKIRLVQNYSANKLNKRN